MLKVNKPPYMPGEVIQVVNTQTGAVATGSTLIPIDDTIPQKTEGDEYMTLAITPKFTTSKLKIEVVFNFGVSINMNNVVVALFQDNKNDALAVSSDSYAHNVGMQNITFTHYMTAETILETTFKLRAGAESASTITFNGFAGARKYGGRVASSITIQEIKQ